LIYSKIGGFGWIGGGSVLSAQLFFVDFACGVLKQVQHDFGFDIFKDRWFWLDWWWQCFVST
jgi:hypothetical protein